MPSLLDRLNEPQKEAATTIEGPLLVLAGAGTGKTSVITARIGHLLDKRVPPEAILGLTFTNKAAAEMRERVSAAVGNRVAEGVTLGTFHSFCVRTLREHAPKLKLPKRFTICDSADQLAMAKGALRELRVAEEKLHPRVLQSKVSLFKNRLISPDAVLDSAEDDETELLGRAYRNYDEQLRRSRSLDFDDLLLQMLRLVREHRDVREGLILRYRFVMVDEYQDTNAPQYEIVREVAGAHRNLCVVGDDDQSIYSWRGADVSKILGFKKDFPEAKVIRLETNYRSTEQILNAANTVIAQNPERHEKNLRSHFGRGEDVVVWRLKDELEESRRVVDDIQRTHVEGWGTYKDMAILIRTQGQARAFEADLRRKSIPYVLVGGMSFFDRKEVKDVLAYLKLLENADDEASLLRVINVPPRGIGKTSIDKILAEAISRGESAGTVVATTDEIPGVPKTAMESIAAFREGLRSLAARMGHRPLVETLRDVLEVTQYKKEVERLYPDEKAREDRWLSVMEILNFAENYERRARKPTLSRFLDELTLNAEDNKSEENEKRNVVTIMTLHSAKGLEFPRVYLVGLEEGILPHIRAAMENGVEEERRLMYVGITRAQRKLVMTFAEQRTKFGRPLPTSTSRFIYELKREEPPEGWYPAGTTPPPTSRSRGKKTQSRRKVRRRFMR